MNAPIQILIVDDSPHFLDAASYFLQVHESLHVVGTATGAEEAIQQSRRLKVDVILLDFNLAGTSGLELIPLFREFLPNVKIIVLTLMEGEGYYTAAIRAGADAFVQKKAMTTALVSHILRVTGRLNIPEKTGPSENEARFFRLVENSPDLIYRYEFTPKRGFTYVNPAAMVISGYSPEEHYADPDLIYKMVHPEDHHFYEELSRGNDSVQAPLVLRWIRKDGVIIWTEQHNISIYDAHGNFTAIEGIARDITAQYLAEKAVRESEDRYRDLVENSQELICTHDLEGQILSSNPAATRMLGYEIGEIQQMNIRDILVPEVKDRFQSYIDELLRNGKASGFMHVHTSTGERRIWEYNNTLRRDGVNRPLVRGMARDVTERVQAEEQMRYQAHLLAHVSDAIISTDEDYIIRSWNAGAERLFGYSAEETIGKPARAVFDYEYIETDREAVIAALRQAGTWQGEVIVIGKAGQRVHTISSTSVLKDEMGKLMGYVAINHDITARKITEQALHKSEAALRKAQLVAQVGSWTWHIPENRLEWSDEMYHIFGIEKETFTGTLPEVISRAIHPEDRALVEQANLAVIRDKHPTPLEYRVIWPDGTVRTVWAEAGELILDASGEALTLTGIVQDITERKLAEVVLRESERFARSTVNALSAHIAILDEHGTILAVNRAWSEFALANHPTPKSVCEGANYLQICDTARGPNSEEAASMAKVLRAVMNDTQQDFGLEYPCHAPDEKRWFVARVTKFEGEGPMRVVVAHENITERKQAEEALREKERLLSEAQRIGSVGSWSYDLNTEAFQFSDEMYRLLDIEPDEVEHTVNGLLKLAYSVDRPMALNWIETVRAGRQPKELDVRILRKDGELRFIHVRGAFIFVNGEPARFTGTAQDVTERKLADIQIHQNVEQLNTLRRIDQTILSGSSLPLTLDILLAEIIKQLRVDAVDVLLFNTEEQLLEYAAGKGFRSKRIESALVRAGESLAGRVAKERRMIRIESLKNQAENALLPRYLAGEDFVSYYGVPLIVKGKVWGVMEVFHRIPFEPYSDWIDFLVTLAGQAAIAIENSILFENLQAANKALSDSYDAAIEGWSRALDLRDKETEGHTLRVTEMTMKLAARMGIGQPELAHIRSGALLHDIGKVGVPDHILLKPEQLSPEEREQVQKHAQFAYDLLRPIAFLEPALEIPYCHHEKWDGSGYPRGLKGEEIPLSARLFAVVDVWDALTSDRPYRPAWSVTEALAYIKDQAGKHFDPQVVTVFLELFE